MMSYNSGIHFFFLYENIFVVTVLFVHFFFAFTFLSQTYFLLSFLNHKAHLAFNQYYSLYSFQLCNIYGNSYKLKCLYFISIKMTFIHFFTSPDSLEGFHNIIVFVQSFNLSVQCKKPVRRVILIINPIFADLCLFSFTDEKEMFILCMFNNIIVILSTQA